MVRRPRRPARRASGGTRTPGPRGEVLRGEGRLNVTAALATKRIATYERVSSEDQRNRETIRTQTDEIARRLASTPGIVFVGRYADDGVSGTIPMGERPAGARLLADAARGLFDQVWVYSVDRLGRGWIDPEIVWETLESAG